jgi:hypothetical protein
MMRVEQSVEWELAGETEVLRENLPQRYFVHYKSHMTSTRARAWATAVGSQRLTAWAMSRRPVLCLTELPGMFQRPETYEGVEV